MQALLPLLLTAVVAPEPAVPPPPGSAPEPPEAQAPAPAPSPPADAPPTDETTEASPSEPAPSEPAPSEPTTTEPATSEPATSEPATSESAPSEPATTTEPAPSEPAPSEPATSEPAACPCDSADWQCMQDNAVACEWGAARPEPVPSDYELPPRPEVERAPQRRRIEVDGPQRTGIMLAAGIGYLGCRTAYACEDIFKGAFTAEGEVGYRWRFVAPVLVVGGGRGKIDVPDDIEDVKAHLGFFDVGVGAMIFPAPRGIFDPYFGLTLGMTRAKIRAEDTLGLGISANETITRGAARFAAGLNFFLSPRVTLGPRFTISVPFSGKWCPSGNASTADECVKIKDLPEEQNIDPADLPRNFTVTVQLRLVLPVVQQVVQSDAPAPSRP